MSKLATPQIKEIAITVRRIQCILQYAIWFIWLLLILFIANTSLAQAEQNEAAKRHTTIASADTYVASGKPDQSWGSEISAVVGFRSARASQQALIKFDLSTVPAGSRVKSAQLSLYTIGYTTDDAPLPISVSYISGSWTESITYDEFDAGIKNGGLKVDETHQATVPIPAQFGPQAWDVSNIAKQCVEVDHCQSIGLLARAININSQRERLFLTRDCTTSFCAGKLPTLNIEYVPPPNVSLFLQSSPRTQLQAGETLTYTLVVKFTAGEEPLQTVHISNTLPAGVTYLPGSASSSDPTNITAEVLPGSVGWQFNVPLPVGTQTSVWYQVSPDTNDLSIVNTGATVSWSYSGLDASTSSNAVFNPSHLTFLPLVRRD